MRRIVCPASIPCFANSLICRRAHTLRTLTSCSARRFNVVPALLTYMPVAADAGAGQFALPVMLASIHQLPAASLGDGSTATITLIARRAAQRAGTRHWRRGADPEVIARSARLLWAIITAKVTKPDSQVLPAFHPAREHNHQAIRLPKPCACGGHIMICFRTVRRAMWRTLWRRSSWWRWRVRGAPPCPATCRSAAVVKFAPSAWN